MSDTSDPNNSTEELSHLGSYKIESRLGQGGMGIVYRATDKHLGRQVAIKVLHPHLLKHENLKQRFRREARMHAKLMHPNIVTLLSLFEDDKHMALVMELVEGADLKIYLKENPDLTLHKKLSISADILTGLEASHQFGMVHRDLKPANVLVSNQGEVKLLDFGLAKPEHGDDDLTQSGATVGSFRYMAPEQILNKPIDARTDLYAFGILLFYMVIGRLPFDATSNGGEFEIMEKQVREPAPSPHKIDPTLPIELSDLILELLDKNKHNRPKSAVIVRESVQHIIDQLHSPKKNSAKKSKKESSVHLELKSPSNSDVAQQWFNHGKDAFVQLWSSALPRFQTLFAGLSGIAFLFTLLGFTVIAVLSMAENSAAQYTKKQQTSIAQSIPSTPSKTTLVKSTPTIKPKPKPMVKKEVEPKVSKTSIVKKEVVKTKVIKKIQVTKKKKIVLSLPYQVKYTLTRSDKSHASKNDSHEFKGGHHVFFPQLAKKSWLSSSKIGESKITFEQPQIISKIILHKASVGRKKFKNGYVRLEVQLPDSNKWKRLFERKGDDVDIKVIINHVEKYAPFIKSVRIRFKSPEPITIGPIDLLP